MRISRRPSGGRIDHAKAVHVCHGAVQIQHPPVARFKVPGGKAYGRLECAIAHILPAIQAFSLLRIPGILEILLEPGAEIHSTQDCFVGGQHGAQCLLLPAPVQRDTPICRVGHIVLDQHTVLRLARAEQQVIAPDLATQIFQDQPLQNQQALLARLFDNRVVAASAAHPVAVHPRTADQGVVALNAVQHVIAGATGQNIAVCIAGQHIIEGAASCILESDQGIPASPPVDGIATAKVDHHRAWIIFMAGNVGTTPIQAYKGIASLAAHQRVDKTAVSITLPSTQDIVPRAAQKGVAAQSPIKGIVPIVSCQMIVAVSTMQIVITSITMDRVVPREAI